MRLAPLLLALALASLPCLPQYASAQSAPPTTSPSSAVYVAGDAFSYNPSDESLLVQGNSQILFQNFLLQAPSVLLQNNTVHADNGAQLDSREGISLLADKILFNLQNSQGALLNPSILIPGNGALAARFALILNNARFVLQDAVYSPCPLCKDNPHKSPLWAVRAKHVVRDPDAKRIRLKHARLEVFGLPVFYLPYISYPEPSVKRAPGFLPVRVSNHSAVGPSVSFPYFIPAGDLSDVTITPQYLHDQGSMLNITVRERQNNRAWFIQSSVLKAKNNAPSRGRFHAQAHQQISPQSSAQFVFHHISDPAFLQDFFNVTDPILTSRLSFSHRSDQHVFNAQALSFIDLLLQDDETPSHDAVPLISYSFFSNDLPAGGLRADASILSAKPHQQPSVIRLATNAQWRHSIVMPFGVLADPFFSIKTDAYLVKRQPRQYRLLPAFGSSFLMPFSKRLSSGASQVFEPGVQFIFAPSTDQSSLPNLDSLSPPAFDDTSLFSDNRFTGLDRVEDGLRLNVGATFSHFSPNGASSSFRVGQTLRAEVADVFSNNPRLQRRSSDVVVSFDASHLPSFSFNSKINLSPNELEFQSLETRISMHTKKLSFNASWTTIRQNPNTLLKSQQARMELTLKPIPTLSFSAQALYDFQTNQALQASASLSYSHPCLNVSFGYHRNLADPNHGKSSRVRLEISLRPA